MKLSAPLFFVTLLVLPFQAYAGLPTEDAAIAKLQADFAAAHTPGYDDLRLGSRWDCQAYNAIQGYTEVSQGISYAFEQSFEPSVAPTLADKEAERLVRDGYVDASQISLRYIFNDGHLVGQPYQDISGVSVHSWVRITTDGTLLIEIASYLPSSLPADVLEQRLARSAPATLYADQRLRLMAFHACRPARTAEAATPASPLGEWRGKASLRYSLHGEAPEDSFSCDDYRLTVTPSGEAIRPYSLKGDCLDPNLRPRNPHEQFFRLEENIAPCEGADCSWRGGAESGRFGTKEFFFSRDELRYYSGRWDEDGDGRSLEFTLRRADGR